MARWQCACLVLLEFAGWADSRALARFRLRGVGLAFAAIGARAFAFGRASWAVVERRHRFFDGPALCRDGFFEAHKDAFGFLPRKEFRRNGVHTECRKAVRNRSSGIRSESRGRSARRD